MNVGEFPTFHYRATLVRVVDGDTIVVNADLGLSTYRRISLRIAGINTPEINKGSASEIEAGIDARDALLDIVPVGTPLWIKTYKDRRSFDRYVADVFVSITGGELVDVAQMMVDAGHAVRVAA